MKKRLLIMTAIVGLLLMLLLAGCSEAQKVSSDELLKPQTTDTLFAQKWVNVYGDGGESVEHYNIALMLRIMNQQDTRIKALEMAQKLILSDMDAHEIKIVDPNEVNK